ncbi:uncharacterized protein LY89DRAFT_728743 [Mollisia scopiformis]|uniref:RING-type E3 ubiquitin transferase n=1 Tax=Mollisia scopiformis TaxID=149040 RepID=A0A194XR42_MOLSC|nr:uncharacterized protein LY89DRAFT_728743 [Mollisia scopiformis]KUJ22621.1 hypothetical protein LY89DRAFT_728743 [Mollisia scopiformis]
METSRSSVCTSEKIVEKTTSQDDTVDGITQAQYIPEIKQSEADNSLSHSTSEEKELCVICQEHVSEPATTQPCNHSNFDFSCLTKWLELSPSCPLCKSKVTTVRYNFTPENTYSVYDVKEERRSNPNLGFREHALVLDSTQRLHLQRFQDHVERQHPQLRRYWPQFFSRLYMLLGHSEFHNHLEMLGEHPEMFRDHLYMLDGLQAPPRLFSGATSLYFNLDFLAYVVPKSDAYIAAVTIALLWAWNRILENHIASLL